MNGNSAQASRRSVIVTGGASGLGLTMAKYFASLGSIVTIFDVNSQAGHKVAEEVATENPQALVGFKRVDVTSWDSQAQAFREVYQQHGKIDVVMANAGISEQGTSSFALVDEEEPSQPRLRTLDVNLTGTIYSVKLAIHYIKKNQPDPSTGSRGSVICTASNAGLYPFPVAPIYAASKFGVIGLVRGLAKILERINVSINALAPAVLETGIAPSKALFQEMVVTPHSTLVKAVAQLVENPSVTGSVAEIHGDKVTMRPPHDYVDEDTQSNLEVFWKLGVA
ncbi:NAD(P)-binding protein [Hypoxylon sp. FL1284]|nr:NAD(P)-binding protein [Hypoxylon sp. FL1284]